MAVAVAVVPGDQRWSVELRDPSWVLEVLEVLARHGAALCIHDLLADHPWERAASWAYLRFHGPRAGTGPYGGRYGPRRLAPMAETLRPNACRTVGCEGK